MMLLGFNRKLAWVAIGAILWALMGLAAAVSQTRHGTPPVRLQVGAPPGEIRIPGRLMSVTESQGQLEIVVGIRNNDRIELPRDLPHDLSITLAEQETQPNEPPQISLDGKPARLGRGLDSHRLDTGRYVIRFGRDEIRVWPKLQPPQLRHNDELRRQRGPWFEQDTDEPPLD